MKSNYLAIKLSKATVESRIYCELILKLLYLREEDMYASSSMNHFISIFKMYTLILVLEADPVAIIGWIVLLSLPFLALLKDNKDHVDYQVQKNLDSKGGIIVVFGDIINFIRNRGCEIQNVKKSEVNLVGKYEVWRLQIKDIGPSLKFQANYPLLGEKITKEWRLTYNDSLHYELKSIEQFTKDIDEKLSLINKTLNND